jgi:hypothetical protein
MMVDIDLLVEALRKRGHKVEGIFKVPDNAGEYEFIVDGNTLNLAETRQLLEADPSRRSSPAAQRRRHEGRVASNIFLAIHRRGVAHPQISAAQMGRPSCNF